MQCDIFRELLARWDTIRYPERARETMIDIVLVVDSSNSMKETDYKPSRARAAADAAIKFSANLAALGVDSRVGIVNFGATWKIVCNMVKPSDVRQVESALKRIPTIGDGTNLTAGLEAAEYLFAKEARKGAVRELHLLTDGHHLNGPLPGPTAARLKKKGCTIYTVGIGGSPTCVDEKLLKEISSKGSDGRPLYRFIADRDSLVRHFEQAGGLMR